VPDYLGAIGSFYRDFRQLADDEVIELLEAASRWTDSEVAPAPPSA
jgi:predicted phosphoribosyltransferase